MGSVSLIPGGKTRSFKTDTLLLDALLDMGLHIQTACGGKGICGKCSVRAEGALSEPDENEKNLNFEKNGFRLACRSRILGDVSLYIEENETSVLNKALPSFNPDDTYAAAIDIGTTSIVVALVNLASKTSAELATVMNPQRRYGHDVISRISSAADMDISDTMSNLVQDAVLHTMSAALKDLGIPFGHIKRITFSGNTTMLYLLFGLDVSPLGMYPYRADHTDFADSEIAEKPALTGSLKIKRVFPDATISALPVLSGFLGGDLTGGLAVCHVKGFTKNAFFIDLGTNGELFLTDGRGRIFAASCAMGPALEGMNISCGMTADDGAITHVWVESSELRYSMMGNGSPRGISGTAVVDLLAIFLETGIIRRSGTFSRDLENRRLPSPARCEYTSASKKIRLWGDIGVTQKDIRNVQLAKGASLAASRLLLGQAGSSSEDIERVFIAGALGRNLSMDNFKRLEFIPDFPNAEYHYLGNSSLMAAQEACLDETFITRAMELRDRAQEVNLSALPEFNKEFINALDFK